jgi:hypothetical protein
MDKQIRNAEGKAFYELVVGEWFHMERMTNTCWWMRVGDENYYIHMDKFGRFEKIVK